MSARVRTRRVRALALGAVGAAAIWSLASFALASTGSNNTAIQPGTSLPGGGGAAQFSAATNASFTRPNGNAQINAGVVLGRVLIARGYGPKIKVDVAWLDPNDAAQVLTNPNAQVYVGLYHPIAQGSSAFAEGSTSTSCGPTQPQVGATRINLSDPGVGSPSYYCAQIDAAATGSLVNDGALVLTPTNVAGYVKASADDSTAAACTNAVPAVDTWCRPAGVDAAENVLWVAMTIVTPQGKPAGQQNNLSDLRFYAQVKTLG